MDRYIHKLQDRQDLTEDEIQTVMHLIMSGKAPQDALGKFLLALNVLLIRALKMTASFSTNSKFPVVFSMVPFTFLP